VERPSRSKEKLEKAQFVGQLPCLCLPNGIRGQTEKVRKQLCVRRKGTCSPIPIGAVIAPAKKRADNRS
jgi:hypothetical protein